MLKHAENNKFIKMQTHTQIKLNVLKFTKNHILHVSAYCSLKTTNFAENDTASFVHNNVLPFITS